MAEYKIQQFLYASAVGMTAGKSWTGIKNETRGVIIDARNGDLVCYHIFNKSRFEDYLFNNTELETSRTPQHMFSSSYKEAGSYFLKLNLQVQFI